MPYTPKNRWTAVQINYLMANWKTMKDTEIAEHLSRSLKSVRRRRERLELKKLPGKHICRAAVDGYENKKAAKHPDEGHEQLFTS